MLMNATRPSVVSLYLKSLLLGATLLMTACGSQYETIKYKHYTLSVVNDQGNKYTQLFRQLAADFNNYSGYEAMAIVDNANDANSAIVITNGLEKSTGKVGYGQMLSTSQSDSPVTLPGKKPKRIVTYAMRIEFDEKYILDNFDLSDATKRTNAQKLFFHESGHGLEMGHDDSSTRNVMHSNIAGTKDFTSYFRQVQAYLDDQG